MLSRHRACRRQRRVPAPLQSLRRMRMARNRHMIMATMAIPTIAMRVTHIIILITTPIRIGGPLSRWDCIGRGIHIIGTGTAISLPTTDSMEAIGEAAHGGLIRGVRTPEAVSQPMATLASVEGLLAIVAGLWAIRAGLAAMGEAGSLRTAAGLAATVAADLGGTEAAVTAE